MDSRRHVLEKPFSGNKFIQIDDGRMVNEDRILWVRQMEECMRVCAKPHGCALLEAYSVCKNKRPESYERLLQLFN